MPSSLFSTKYPKLMSIIAQTRIDAGVTQVELAARLGKPQSYVSKYERGERRIDVVEFCDITIALGSDPVAVLKRYIDDTVNIITL